LNEANDENENIKKDDEHLKKQLEALKKYSYNIEIKLKKK